MANKSSIEWTESTWNPVTGCSKISPGCKNCYAERMSKRLQRIGVDRYKNAFELTIHPDVLNVPLSWKTPKTIFVNSMSDLFHEKIPLSFIQDVFDVMKRAHWHTFQVLTKRSERLMLLAPMIEWPDNVWMGVSVESQKYIDRIDHLRAVPSAVRFLSVEPLISRIDKMNLKNIDWVIVGGESGPKARRLEHEWVIHIKNLCKKYEVPFFFKQWGGTRKHKTGRSLLGKTWDNMPTPKNPRRRRAALKIYKPVVGVYRSMDNKAV
jgi:protein gp37